MTSVLSFIFVLGVLVFIHELGHFLVAKWVGVRVEKFSLGFPPNIVSRKMGDTTYCIGLIPLGGFVKMAGDNPTEDRPGAQDEFLSKTVAQRTAVIAAGPFMNYVLSIVILIGIYMFSGTPLTDDNHIYVGDVSDDGPAMHAGLMVDDEIIGIDGETVSNFDSLRVRINARIVEPVAITWVHGSDTINREITTMVTTVPNAQGGQDSLGIIGFTQKIIGYEKMGVGEAIGTGFITAHVIVYETLNFFRRFVTGQLSPRLIGGPLFIARQSGREAQKGAASLFFFMALLSVNLAVINVLPIPILDGGHLVFLIIEKIKGKPVSVTTLARAQQAGLLILLVTLVFVTYNDILRVFSGH
jgi:regulator of sigma E protease